MGHASWEELQRQQAIAATEVPIGSLRRGADPATVHEVVGHCIIEATDETGILYRARQMHGVIIATPLANWSDVATNNPETPTDEWDLRCRLAGLKLPTGSVWEHTKTKGTYKILGRCVLDIGDAYETGVLYHSLAHTNVTFTRSLVDWLSLVRLDTGEQVPRFQELG